ncbi:armadillo-type protein [Circinella umbellata]|nr:armadillo-type protein [Circinella umbellata]
MASSTPSIPEAFTLDEQKLQGAEISDKQELYLLQWLAQVERECKTIDSDILKRAQPQLEKTLLRLISLGTAKPRRPIRFLIGRCFVLCYTRGETRMLFDTVTALHSLINANKSIDKEAKIAAVSTTGAIMGATGSKVLSLFAETAAHLTKVIKTNNNPLLLRLEAVNAFTLLLKGAGKAATEPILKELTKHLKHGLVDKALVMRVACAQCMQAVIQHAKQTFTQHDVENFLQIFLKAFEGSTFPVRRAVSSLCATLLAFTQTTATTDPNKPNIKHAITGEENARSNNDIQIINNNTLMSVDEMLNLLSNNYNRPNVSREFKIGIIETYATLFVLLGTEFVESNYPVIARHVLKELLDGTKQSLATSDGSFARAQVFFLLHSTIGKRLLSEQGQAMAIRHLISEWVKSWPPLKRNQLPPNKHALICATNLISALVCELGGGASVVKDIVVDPLFVLLTHPNFSVQAAAAWCIRCVCYSVPSNLPYLLPRALNTLEKDLANISNPSTTPDLLRRVIAYAYTVGSIMSVFPARPIYTSFELSARAMSLATHLLKNPSKSSAIAGIQIQVAWILVGSLMSLGPNLVKLHLPQLLLLWKSALPKPTGKEANAIRAEVEWSYLFHIRECAISSIYSFLVHNSTTLVTLDVAKRIAALLNNTLAFLATAPNSFSPATMSPCVPHQTRLVDQYYMLRRRIFQCFVTIRPLLSTYESSLTSLLRNSLNVFIELDKVQPSSGAHAQVTASVPGQFISVWSSADGHGYGVTSKMQGYRTDVAKEYDDDDDNDDNGSGSSHGKEWVTKDRFQRIEELLERPIIGSVELDPIYIYTTFASTTADEGNETLVLPRPVAPSTGYIDTSIELFATLFPSQPPPVQESTFEHIASVVKDARLEKNSPKRAAVLVNVTVALLGAFKNMMSSANKKKTAHGIPSGRATQLVQEILMEAIVHPDPYLRNAASETIGRLTAIVGGSFVAAQMQQLVDLVVSNRDPDVRAGCALAIGYIYTHVGGMAAAPHLKTLFGILVSLSSDPHPVVHAWALEAIAMTVRAAGLMFSTYVNSTLGMVAKLYLSETHEPGSGSIAVSNAGMSVGFSAYQEFGRIIYELIGTLGPELQASSKIRELCLNMVEELKLEPDERVNVEAIRCIQHFLMFAPHHLNTQELVPYLQGQIVSLHLPLKKAAVTCLYQLVQRDAELVFKAAQPGLDTELFKMLDTDPGLSDVKNVIKSWLKETALHEPSVWVNITKRILSGTNKPDGTTKNTTTMADLNISSSGGSRGGSFDGPNDTSKSGGQDGFGDDDDDEDLEDDDGAGFGDDDQQVDITTSVADASGMTSRLTVNVEIPPRWRTQLFALQCLQRTIEIIASSGTREHFDLIYARARRQQAGFGDYLVFRVPDLIKLSFTAATAHVDELRLAGISLLRMVIEKFATTADPDLEGTLLLEQYAAQIGAALTPAFGADSSSEIVSAAVRVCAIYVGSGIVKDLYQLSRVLKLLVSSLDKVKSESELTGVGEVKDLSPHASVMVKLSVLNAWAELQVASQRQDYLRQILQPNLSALSPLWLRSLQDYARIRLESDIVALTSSAEGIQTSSSGGIESMYSAATKQVVLPYYRKSWLKIMEAVASLIENGATSMLDALSNNPDAVQAESDKPSNLFYILFGLCIESLSRISSSSSGRSDISTMVICLKALKTFIQPSLAGEQFLPKAIFLELMNVFDRLIQTEGYRVQLIIIEIIQRLTKNYGASYLCNDLTESQDGINDDLKGTILEDMDRALEPSAFPSTAKLYYVLRLLINVFLQKLPSLSTTKRSSTRLTGTNQEQVAILLGPCLDELGMLVNIAPPSYKIDLLAICFYIFSEILMDSKLDKLLAPRVLVSLKSMLPQLETALESTEKRTLARLNCAMLHSLLDNLFKEELKEINENMLKNKLLASVLIITGCPEASIYDADGRNIFVNTMKQALQSDTKEIALTAHQCMRMLITLPEKRSDSPASVSLGKSLLSALIPAIVQHLLSFQNLSNTITDDQLVLLNEDVKTLITLPTAVHNDTEKSSLLSIVLPTLAALLDPVSSTQEATTIHRTVITQILTLATSIPQAFKDTVSQLPDHVRTQLETSVRQSVLSSQEQQQKQQQKIQRQQEELQRNENTNKPTIQLKMDFSNFS